MSSSASGPRPVNGSDPYVVGMPGAVLEVLHAERHAGERTGILAARDGLVDRRGGLIGRGRRRGARTR